MIKVSLLPVRFRSYVLLVVWRSLPVIAATDADYSKAFAFVSTLAVIPGASWEQLPRRTRLRNNDAVIDQFLKSNVPNWPAGPSQTQVLWPRKASVEQP